MENSVPTIYRPENLMQDLGIAKDAYYADVKYLGIQVHRDEDNRVYLDSDQAELIRKLRRHVEQTGRRDGFTEHLAPATGGEPLQLVTPEHKNGLAQQKSNQAGLVDVDLVTGQGQTDGVDAMTQQLISGASALAAHKLTLPQQTVLALADQMQYDDLLPGDKAKVDAIQQACSPKGQAVAIASRILNQRRGGHPPAQVQTSI